MVWQILILQEFTGTIWLLGGWCMKNQYIRGKLPKNGGMTKKKGLMFLRSGWDPKCTLWDEAAILLAQTSKTNNTVRHWHITNNNYNWHIVSTYLEKNEVGLVTQKF